MSKVEHFYVNLLSLTMELRELFFTDFQIIVINRKIN